MSRQRGSQGQGFSVATKGFMSRQCFGQAHGASVATRERYVATGFSRGRESPVSKKLGTIDTQREQQRAQQAPSACDSCTTGVQHTQ